MSETFQFRNSLFETILRAELLELNETDYEKEIFNYLNSINELHKDYNELEQFSRGLENLSDLEWLNVSKGLNISKDLKGKMVLIDFWTYCCINCMHLIPLLNRLETEFPELVVIGVHSSKFSNEKSKANILSAIRRHLIKHPVVCDVDLKMWTDLQIICWPTLILLNPSGIAIAEFQGETQANLVRPFLTAAYKFYESKLTTTMSSGSSPSTHFRIDPFDEVCSSNSKDQLYFPTKLCLDSIDSTLFVSNSGTNQILAIDLIKNELKYSIGNGKCGCVNGGFENAQFDWPQGLAFDESNRLLYIADTFNDVIRVADLNKRQVSTLCGVSNKSLKNIGEYDLVGGKHGNQQPISSPWDLILFEKETSKVLLIACAGTHQIWLYSFESKSINPIESSAPGLNWWRGLKFEWERLVCVVGNGKESNRNNSYPLKSSLAQPSGMCLDSTTQSVYIADAESSTIRVLSLKDGSVKNMVGGDNLQPDNLFAYGDQDGKGTDAKLQHPLDVKLIKQNDQPSLLIADTYNNCLKLIDIKSKYCKKLSLNVDGRPTNRLNEPNGICVDSKNETIWITDTNNHSIKLIRNFNSNSFDHNLEEMKINILNSNQSFNEKMFDNLSFKDETIANAILIDFNVELNFDATNNWKLIIDLGKQAKLDFKGQFETKSEINSLNGRKLFRLIQNEFDLLEMNELEIHLNVFYCVPEKQNSQLELCKMLNKTYKFDKQEINKLFHSNLKSSILILIDLE